MKDSKDYYIGLDCGTSSVGWAVTDENYNLLRAKGKDLWGSRLFDEANTAKERRVARGTRRRLRRTADRIKLLNLLFADEMAKIDPEFYLRLKKSFLLEEDKNLNHNSKNTIFNDPDFTDKDFHKKYPTIWHLRKAIIEAPANAHFDLRLYYLAIHHILKNRGHFLRSDEKIEGAGDFNELYAELQEVCDNFGIELIDGVEDKFSEIVSSHKLGRRDKRKAIEDLIFGEPQDFESIDNSLYKKQCSELAGLIAGSKVYPIVIFSPELSKDDVKDSPSLSFADGNIEEKLAEVEASLDSDQFALVESAKKIYDFGYLSELLGGESLLSNAMVKNYDIHKKQLQELKTILKPHKEAYDIFFKTEKITSDKIVCYNAYIGKAYTEDKSGRRKASSVDQETINKEILRLLKEYAPNESDLISKAENGQLLPKQRGQAKGTIPQQLHHSELQKILAHLASDYPSFAKKTDEPEDYNTKCKKIERLHDFRIPYYCGPLKGDEHTEIAKLVRPWNFKDLVPTDRLANSFIRRMTNSCTYLPSEETLPKASPLYQKYMVLNELNNLKINGTRIDQDTKKSIYDNVFVDGQLRNNITLKQLSKWLRDNGYLNVNDELSGSSENKFLPKLSTHQDFKSIFGANYESRFKEDSIEEAVNLITILNNEPAMLRQKLAEVLPGATEDEIKKLSRRAYKDWGKFSKTFLTEIKIEKDGRNISIIEMLEEGAENLMELLGNKYKFSAKIEEFNNLKNPPKTDITYEDVHNLYCSPAVKRTIWQSIKIIDELVKVEGHAPEKIFLEATRDGEDPRQKGEKLSRHRQLKDKYSAIKSEEAKELLEELNSYEPRDLQSKKLYLYFSQMGHCAYCGGHIHVEDLATSAYDIDHIYPRSKTKDDSITRNLVLVHASENREKTNNYPISADIRAKMSNTWSAWRRAELITKEKYDRLVRTTPLTTDELSGFIARQIVETAQSVKALRDLLEQKYPETKIVLVKASQVSDFRHYFANGYKKYETGEVVYEGRPEFIKLRALNDLHHAKDAYLNIVVGNVMSMTFTDNPFKWLKSKQDKGEENNYSLNSHNLWRREPSPRTAFLKGWHYSETIELVSKNLKKNSQLWTRMTHRNTGAITDLLPVGKGDKVDGLVRLKKNLDPKKYGGYNGVKGSIFALIDETGNTKVITTTLSAPSSATPNISSAPKQATSSFMANSSHFRPGPDPASKPKTIKRTRTISAGRKIVPIPIYAKDAPAEYLAKTYPTAKVIIPEIQIESLFQLNDIYGNIRGVTGNSLIFAPAIQLFLSPSLKSYLKHVTNVNKKILADKKYEIDESRDHITRSENLSTFNTLVEKIRIFKDAPGLSNPVAKLQTASSSFEKLGLKEQCKTLENIITAFGCNTSVANLTTVIDKAGHVGKCTPSNTISELDKCTIILQSPTGLFERKIDLKTCPPQNLTTEEN